MAVSRQDDMHAAFSAAIRACDLEAVVSLYEEDAVPVPQPGQIVKGRAAIRAGLRRFLAQRPEFTLEESSVIHAGDVALLQSRWAVNGPGADGTATIFHVRPTQVARRQPDGTWQVTIDEPS